MSETTKWDEVPLEERRRSVFLLASVLFLTLCLVGAIVYFSRPASDKPDSYSLTADDRSAIVEASTGFIETSGTFGYLIEINNTDAQYLFSGDSNRLSPEDYLTKADAYEKSRVYLSPASRYARLSTAGWDVQAIPSKLLTVRAESIKVTDTSEAYRTGKTASVTVEVKFFTRYTSRIPSRYDSAWDGTILVNEVILPQTAALNLQRSSDGTWSIVNISGPMYPSTLALNEDIADSSMPGGKEIEKLKIDVPKTPDEGTNGVTQEELDNEASNRP